MKKNLESFYAKKELPPEELDELLEHYSEISDLWQHQFDQISEVRLVLLGEAPLFGVKQSYFYNPAIGATAFFGYKHFNDIAGHRFGECSTSNKTSTAEKKRILLSKMRDAGILVLDLFPLPLNKTTSINYSDLSDQDYEELFQATVRSYLEPKLSKVQTKMLLSANFVFRYARLRDRVRPSLDHAFRMAGLDVEMIYSGHVGGSFGNLNTSLLRSIYESSF